MSSTSTLEPRIEKRFASFTKEIASTNLGDERYDEAQNNATHHPVVRYGSISDNGVSQWYEFHSIDDPVPEDAQFVSGIYLLTDDEKSRLSRLNEKGIEYLPGGKHRIRDTQDRCEDENRVLHPIHFEADTGDSWQQQIRWITDFVDKHLPVRIHLCEWYHSGSRSIHCHVPLFVRETGLDRLRTMVQDHDGELDAQIYQRKNQFRIPGVEHGKTGFWKTPIEPEWSDERIGQEIVNGAAEKPDTYAELVGNWETWNPFTSDPLAHEPGQAEPDDEFLHDRWQAHNNHHFSPYANSGNGSRSIVTAEIDGKPFGKDSEIFVPCYVNVAISANREFAWKDRYCPIKLSKTDYRKFDDMGFETFQHMTIIGSGSGSSRIMKTSRETSQRIHDTLTTDKGIATGNVREAHAILETTGHDVGESKKITPKGNGKQTTEPTRAETLQMQAERRGILSLTHEEQLKVANRLLRTGTEKEAHRWFKQQLGDKYNQQKTQKKFDAIVERYGDLL